MKPPSDRTKAYCNLLLSKTFRTTPVLAGKAPIAAPQSVVAGRAVHVLFTARNIRAVEAVQVRLRNLRYQAPVWDRLGHSIDCALSREEKRRLLRGIRETPSPHAHPLATCWSPYHACGLGAEVLHDLLDAVSDVSQELLGNPGLCVQLRNAEVNAGWAGERGKIHHLKYGQHHVF